MEPFAALMLMGARVREVRDLAEGAVWVEESMLLLIDADLTSAAREEVSRQTLGMVAEISV